MTRRIDLGGGLAVERECWRGARGGLTCLGWPPTGFVFGDSSHELELARLFTRVHATYVPIAPNARGDIPIAALGLALGVRPTDPRPNWGVSPWLRWIDEAGAPLPLIKERAARAEAERDAAAHRIAELEAELRRARGD